MTKSVAQFLWARGKRPRQGSALGSASGPASSVLMGLLLNLSLGFSMVLSMVLFAALGVPLPAAAEPDEEALGKALGYPLGVRWSAMENRVGSWSALDRVPGLGELGDHGAGFVAGNGA